jgi:glycosyltransferase involved in cell wall biosynthesis
MRIDVRMIGKPHPNSQEYAAAVQAWSKGLPVVWDLGLSADDVAERLSRTRIAYLPFPDGASERRGSLIALLAQGVPTVTTRGVATPQAMEDAVVFASGPREALGQIKKILEDSTFREQLSERARDYARRFSWDAIAVQHKELYARIA